MAKLKSDKMERFAFDTFVHTMSRFKIITDLPSPDCSENTYENPDFISVISNGIIFFQLAQRDIRIAEFEAKFKLNGLKKFLQISKLLEELLKEMDRTVSMPLYKAPDRDPIVRSIESLALISELIQFLYSKNQRLFLNQLARFWRNYLASYQEKFEEKGGLSSLYSNNLKRFKSLHEKIDDFIRKFCFPYGKFRISSLFAATCIRPSLVDGLKSFEEIGSELTSTLMKNLSISSKSPKKSKDKEPDEPCSLENPGLGISPHEALLRDSYSGPPDKETSAENLIASIGLHPDNKLLKNVSGQTSLKRVQGTRQLSTQISSPEGGPIDSGLIASSLNPDEQSKCQGGLTGTTFTPEEQLMYQGDLTGSTLSPKEPFKTLDGSSGSPLSPEGQSQESRSFSGSPAGHQEQKHCRGSAKASESISRLEQKRQKLRQRKNLDN